MRSALRLRASLKVLRMQPSAAYFSFQDGKAQLHHVGWAVGAVRLKVQPLRAVGHVVIKLGGNAAVRFGQALASFGTCHCTLTKSGLSAVSTRHASTLLQVRQVTAPLSRVVLIETTGSSPLRYQIEGRQRINTRSVEPGAGSM